MTYRELRRKLESLSCRYYRQADGSHEMRSRLALLGRRRGSHRVSRNG